MSAIPGFGSVRAGYAFGLLATIFVLAFGIMAGLLALDQQHSLEATRRLQEQTVPEIIRYQRLARNLEQLRQEGERIFSAAGPQARQQAIFVVSLVAGHPSVLEHPEAAALARQSERFLTDAVRQASRGEISLAANYDEWQRTSARLSQLIDDVSIQGINLASIDLGDAARAMQLARYKLMAILLMAAIFLIVFIVLMRVHLIHPLQRIDRTLSTFSVDRPVPEFRPSGMILAAACEQVG